MNFAHKRLLVDGLRGHHIPAHFAKHFDLSAWHVGSDPALLDPESPDYSEAWDDVLRDAYYIDSEGVRWELFVDGDLWAVVYGEDN